MLYILKKISWIKEIIGFYTWEDLPQQAVKDDLFLFLSKIYKAYTNMLVRERIITLYPKHIYSVLHLIWIVTSFIMINTSISVAAEPGNDVKGWSKAIWGMTEEEVLKTFEGQAQRRELPIQLGYKTNSIDIKKMMIGHYTFNVSFYFATTEKKLMEIMLDFHGKPDFKDFEVLTKMMTKKYGEPSESKESRSFKKSIVFSGTTWNFPSTKITLIYTEDPKLKKLLLDYSEKSEKEDLP
jgi:hypothetical protein